MQGHVNGLNDMIGEQFAYTESTSESFTATDEEAAESQAEAQEAADEAEEKYLYIKAQKVKKYTK
jgi:hypothetical protein